MTQLSLTERLKKKLNRRAVGKLVENLPKIQENKIVFYASNDFSDNCLALYEYMVAKGIDRKYDIVWLVRDVDRAKARNARKPGGRARFVKVKDDRIGIWMHEAQKEAMSARYLFFTHSLNWVKVKRHEQTFVNLWHGCGYKGEKTKNGKKNKTKYFDICTVTGPKYVEAQAKMFETEKEKIIPTGYARTDWFITEKDNDVQFCESLKKNAKATRIVIWMPTFRQSTLARLDDSTGCGELGLPLAETQTDIARINELCRKRNILLIIKTHNLQKAYSIEDMSNVMCVDNNDLENMDVNLYGFLANTDSLITDYSSVAIDYMLLDKPIGYILDDFDEYEKVRGWDLENVRDYMPGEHIFTLDDLERFLEDIAEGRDPHREWRHRVNAEVNVVSDNHCNNIIEYLKL